KTTKLGVWLTPDQKNPGGYNPINNVISFRREDDICYNVLLEELFHVYQNEVEGLEKFTKGEEPIKGRSNMEFEAKLYADITNLVNQKLLLDELEVTFQYMGSNGRRYASWLKELTNDFTRYPSWQEMKRDYFDRMQEFIQEKSSYAFPVDKQLQPKTLLKVLEE
ncbi:MAG: hypothetical protein AAFO69_12895, partial [Bacteroidota bacterium]